MFYDHAIPPMDRHLAALDGVLAKATAHCEAHAIDPAVLFATRLFPDMFPLSRQVQLTCDFAARCAARLAGVDPQSFPDTETDFAGLHSRIKAVRDYIGSFERSRFTDAPTRVVTVKLRSGDMVMSGADYLNIFALPQFYFHSTTVYDILRANGVPLGKRDFMGA